MHFPPILTLLSLVAHTCVLRTLQVRQASVMFIVHCLYAHMSHLRGTVRHVTIWLSFVRSEHAVKILRLQPAGIVPSSCAYRTHVDRPQSAVVPRNEDRRKCATLLIIFPANKTVPFFDGISFRRVRAWIAATEFDSKQKPHARRQPAA